MKCKLLYWGGIISCVLALFSCEKQTITILDTNGYIEVNPVLKKRYKHSQGMAICNNLIFVADVGGRCDVYDFETKRFISSFHFASSSPTSHCNCLNFNHNYDNSVFDSLPPIYISNSIDSPDEWKCFVELVSCNGSAFTSTLVQTITLDASLFEDNNFNKPWGAPQWLIDNESESLWVWSANIRTLASTTGDFSNNLYHATRFRIPKFDEGKDITLTAFDVLEQVSFEFDAYATQGGCMHNGIVYYSYGFGNSQSPSKIRAYDTRTGEIVWRLDLYGRLDEELEDLCFYNKCLYVNTNSFWIYKIDGRPNLISS